MNTLNIFRQLKECKNKSKTDFINFRKDFFEQIFLKINGIVNKEIETMENNIAEKKFENHLSISCLNGLIKCEINWNQDSFLNYNSENKEIENLNYIINKQINSSLKNSFIENSNDNEISKENNIISLKEIKEDIIKEESESKERKINNNNKNNNNINHKYNNNNNIPNKINNIPVKNYVKLNSKNIRDNTISKSENPIKIQKINHNNSIIKNQVKEDFNINTINSLSEKEQQLSNILKHNLNSLLKINNKEEKKCLSEINKFFFSYNYSNYFLNFNPENKLNLVVDLFNTLVYGNTLENENKVNENQFIFKYEEKEIKVGLRKNINFFFNELSKFCNIYIYSNIKDELGKIIIDKLKERFSIKINSYYDSQNNNKDLKNLNLNKQNTLIIDDMVNVWKNEKTIILPSKKFINKDKNQEKILICYNYNNIKEGKIENIKKTYENSINYFIETENCNNEGQLYYLVRIIQIIYILVNNLKIKTSLAFSLIRGFLFYGYSFNLKYCTEEIENDLKFMIETLGGEILNAKQASYALIGKKVYEKDKNKIIEMKNNNNPIFLVKEDFLIDSFYNIHKMNEYDYIIE